MKMNSRRVVLVLILCVTIMTGTLITPMHTMAATSAATIAGTEWETFSVIENPDPGVVKKVGDPLVITSSKLTKDLYELKFGNTEVELFQCGTRFASLPYSVTNDVISFDGIIDLTIDGDGNLGELALGDAKFTFSLKGGSAPTTPTTPCPTPSESKKEAPAEPPTPAEELRAAEEEALPLAIVEKDKTQVTKEEVGIVPDKAYNLSAYVTTKGFVSALNKITKANAEAKSVSIFTGKPFTFNKGIVEAINKGGKDVVYFFNYKEHLYSVTVPANVDPTSILEKGGHAGPLYVGKVLGTTRLVK